MDYLYEFCQTDRQREILSAVIAHGGQRPAARALGLNSRTVDKTIVRIKRNSAAKAVSPEHDLNYPLAPGEIFVGRSVYTETPSGQKVWIKTKVEDEFRLKQFEAAIDAMKEELPQVEHRDFALTSSDSLMAFYPLGDPHIGMRAWAKECGEDWDLAIAEQQFISVFDRLVKTAPRCRTAVIANLGDYFHADNMEGVTSRSGHHLDLDGRYAKMIDVGVKIIRRMIESALEHHEHVIVINSIGNHDDTGALFLSVALKHMYEKEPRVTINTDPTPFHYIRHGKCLVGFHHGHTCKAEKLPLVMATDRAAEWGDTTYRYWYTGHIHHDTLKEYPGVKVESFRTLAAKDAYATWNGYRSGQDSKCIVLDKHRGEVERHTVSLEVV